MGRHATLKLSHQDRTRLEAIFTRGENWRERERANTLLQLDDGWTINEVSEIIGIHFITVASTRRSWLTDGFAALSDKPRSGAPRKITEEQLKCSVKAASEKPLTAQVLLAQHIENGGKAVHVNTLIGALKSAGLVWKRTRHSLKKKR